MTDTHSNDRGTGQQPDDSIWELIAVKVDELVAAWKATGSQSPLPSLREVLRDVPEAEQLSVLWELIKIDLEYRWDGQRAPECLEFYLSLFPEIGGTEQFPVDLIYEEYKIRSQAVGNVDLSELPDRFPHQASELQTLLGTLVRPNPDNTDRPTDATTSFVDEGGDKKREIDQFSAGDTVDDFDLLLLLGSGSFARVFLARQNTLDRLVALKISKSVGSEPRTLAQLDHPNIVRVFDQRTCASTNLRLLYMELVPGGTLQDIVRRVAQSERSELSGQIILDEVDLRLAQSGAPPPEGSSIRYRLRKSSWCHAVCYLGSRLADGLDYAHQRGVLHRDIKPANVLMTPEGAPKLADFNVSYQGGRNEESPEDTFGGSLAYMSPEQIAACHPALEGSPRDVGETSDVYSLGVVLWELVVGKRPFDDPSRTSNSNWAATLQQMLDDRRTVDADELCARLPPECPESLLAVLRKSLAPDVRHRFQTARHLTDALRLCLHPRCWRLLQPPERAAERLVLRYPTLTVLTVTLIPSIFAAVFNLLYNRQQIVRYLHEADRTFDTIQAVINAIAFPLGIALTVYIVHRTTRYLGKSARLDSDSSGRSVLGLGHAMARLALTLWMISGLAYPLSLHVSVPDSVTPGVYVHFALSLALCGALASTYPFFFVTWLAIRVFLPEMIRQEVVRGPRSEDVDWLRQLNRIYLVMTALVPLLGILLILLYSQEGNQALRSARTWLIIASATGLLGFAWMFWLHRVIDEDLLAFRFLSPDADDADGSSY